MTTATRLYHCDSCSAPMCTSAHYSANSTSAGCETEACLLCAGRDDAEDLNAEITELYRHEPTPAISRQIGKLIAALVLAEALEQRRFDERDFPRAVAADARRGL